MKSKIFLALGLVALLAFTSCDDFLDKDPSKNTRKTLTDVSQLEAILASYSSMYDEPSMTFLATDDYGLTPELEKQRSSSTGSDYLEVFTWSDNNSRTRYGYWYSEYQKIYRANLAINNIGNVAGSDAAKANVLAEAHLDRAWSMFNLLIEYCLYPSEENSGELGLPLKATTSFEESVARQPLGETVEFIENDIQEALKITKPLTNGDVRETWRGNTAAANGLAARFYLYLGQFDKARGYADAALAEYSTLKDFNDPAEMYYHSKTDDYTINSGEADEQMVQTYYPYTKPQLYSTSSFRNLTEWKELYFMRTMTFGSWWFIPSKDLMATYGRDVKDGNPDNDLRYRYFILENFFKYLTKTNASKPYAYAYAQFFIDTLISGPTTAEMILIRAEAFARAGQVSEAMAELNKLRRARIATDAYEPLTASSKDDAIKKVCDERRREMAMTQRWFDIKRYAYTPDTADDIVVHHPFFPYTSAAVQMSDPVQDHVLELKSRHYALPIPESDIINSDGVLQQNTY